MFGHFSSSAPEGDSRLTLVESGCYSLSEALVPSPIQVLIPLFAQFFIFFHLQTPSSLTHHVSRSRPNSLSVGRGGGPCGRNRE